MATTEEIKKFIQTQKEISDLSIKFEASISKLANVPGGDAMIEKIMVMVANQDEAGLKKLYEELQNGNPTK